LPGQISTTTAFVLVNAVYFKASWNTAFDATQTQAGPFSLLDGTQASAQMMHQTIELPFFKGGGVQAVQLPYVGGRMAMLLVVPDSGQFDAVQSTLSPTWLAQISSNLASTNIALSMPKFAMTTDSLSLSATLTGLGMTDAFGAADFSGIDGRRDLSISDVIHKAFLSVDEAGTEAAAATAVIGDAGSYCCPPPPLTVAIDRPFFVFIQDQSTQTILFMGRIVSP
jgi:serpin B